MKYTEQKIEAAGSSNTVVCVH